MEEESRIRILLGGIMEEASWRNLGRITEKEAWKRNLEGGIMERNHGGGIMEEAWRRNLGGEIMDEESGRHLGSI